MFCIYNTPNDRNLQSAITLGAGNNRPQGHTVKLSSDPVKTLAAILERHSSNESWWSAHRFQNNYRDQANWQAASAIPLDLDYHDNKGVHSRISEDPTEPSNLIQSRAIDRLKDIANIIHRTPRGLRAIVVLEHPTGGLDEFKSTARGVAAAVRDQLGDLVRNYEGVEIDTNYADNARFLYTPNATVNGERRSATVEIAEPTPWPAGVFSTYDPGPPRPEQATHSEADAKSIPLGKVALDFVANGAQDGEQRTRAVATARNYLSAGYSIEDTASALMRGFNTSPQRSDWPWTWEDAVAITKDLAKRAPSKDLDYMPHFQTLPVGSMEVRYERRSESK